MESSRIRRLGSGAVRPDGRYVLYWMTASRRLSWNHGLDHALGHARTLGRPLLILEAVRAGYRWASVRHHGWIVDGMREHEAELRGTPVGYHPYVEPAAGEGSGLLERLASDACVVVTDDWPAFFLPRMIRAAATRVPVRFEAVDSCGLVPLAVPGRTFTAAFHFRRWLQKNLPPLLDDRPDPEPLAGGVAGLPAFEGLPEEVLRRWPAAGPELLGADADLGVLPIDASVGRTADRGGTGPARDRLNAFLRSGLGRYEERNHPDAEVASGLSPWLHYGHISAHEVFTAVAETEGWTPLRLSSETSGKRAGWWGMSAPAEAFLDQLVTWRELGFVHCRHDAAYDRYDALPDWARATLADHAGDPREWVYDLDAFAAAETHDPVWNAAQRQLAAEGVIHNYLRMLWGKKILEWTADPREALDVMIELNNRYAVDGRDPNSYSGIFWTMGRFDRGWPERAVYGKVRSMSSERTRKKVRLDAYMERWGR